MKYLITGGTGSLGTELTKRLLEMGHEVTIYSRDEYKQRNIPSNPNIHLFVGDIKDRERTIKCFEGIDYVVHAAAMKHVPVGEEDSEETIKTNIIGTMNVVDACIENNIKKCILVATDKACHPVNLYGATKMVGEKLFTWANLRKKTIFCSVRYGNVVGSRGSIIEKIIKENLTSVNATHPNMTRFWISLKEAVDLVLLAFDKGNPGDIIIPKAPACGIVEMFKWLKPDIEIKFTGMRPGEKYHESMINKDESIHTEEHDTYFVIKPELFGVTYSDRIFEYTSENCPRITKDEFLKLI